MREQEAEAQKRLQRYRSILKSSPACAAAVEAARGGREGETDVSLYLYVFAPVLTEFVNWVLNKASAAHKDTLYFLSRDGYQMYLTALKLKELLQLPIECRYLNVSRRSVRLPQYHLDLDKSMDRICTGGIDVTLERILQRAALSLGETEEVIRDSGWQDRRKDILNYREIQKLKQALRSRTKILQYVDRHSREEYENAMGYLEQEGLLSDVSYAIVDSGWVGTLQESIQTLVQSRNPSLKVEGYYFGMYELPRGADAGSYHAWYFTPDGGLKRKAYFSNSLFETVCSADEGMTVCYREKDGRFLPVKDSSGNPNSLQLERNLAALENFLAALEKAPGQPAAGRPGRKDTFLAEKLFDLFMAHPTETEVLAYGDNLFSDDVLDGNRKKAAAELTEQEIRNQRFLSRLLIAAGIRKSAIRESAWIEGSIVRCGKHVKRNLIHARLYKYLVFARKQARQGEKKT
ncbi:MAG: hypothetical protein NC123_18725 [Butyrivibrio sp.]|nr:hypothetical protein [Acetatifactor muris]MCM1561547.1 hypothetical protein [Butyrivibrio sp.]